MTTSYKLSIGSPTPSGRHVNWGGGDQLPELDQLHVPWRSHHGNCCGALRSSQQGSTENNHAGEKFLKGYTKVLLKTISGWDKPSSADAGVHVHHNVLVHVDLQYRHYRHDASYR